MKLNKKILLLFLVGILIFSMTACNSEDNTDNTNENEIVEVEEEDDDSNETPESTTETNNEEDEDDNEDIKEADVTLFFVNEDATALVEEKRTINISNAPAYEVALVELLEGPKSDNVVSLIPDELEVKSVTLDDDMAVVDFQTAEISGGSLEEEFTINQIVNTLLNINDISSVQFKMNGEIIDSLMGHYDISEPISDSL